MEHKELTQRFLELKKREAERVGRPPTCLLHKSLDILALFAALSLFLFCRFVELQHYVLLFPNLSIR